MSNVIPIRPPGPPRQYGTIHVRLTDDGWMVDHESSSGGSWGLINIFPPDQMEQAYTCAVASLPKYRICNLSVEGSA